MPSREELRQRILNNIAHSFDFSGLSVGFLRAFMEKLREQGAAIPAEMRNLLWNLIDNNAEELTPAWAITEHGLGSNAPRIVTVKPDNIPYLLLGVHRVHQVPRKYIYVNFGVDYHRVSIPPGHRSSEGPFLVENDELYYIVEPQPPVVTLEQEVTAESLVPLLDTASAKTLEKIYHYIDWLKA